MQNLKLKIKNFSFCLIILIFVFWVLNLSGCATLPPTQKALPTYSLNGTKYFPLISFCEQEGLTWDYDIFTKVITLEKNSQKIILRPKETIVLVNGSEKNLHFPVEIRQGIVLLPLSFKTQIFDPLFKPVSVGRLPAGPPLCKIRKIVIDAGHGGKDPGAIGRTGLREKDVVLDIARKVARRLEKAGKEVILTRSTDVFVSLERRVEIANRNNADIFVSIHANANRARSLSGFEVYCLSNSVDDFSRALAFAENNNSLNLEDTSFYNSSSDLKAIVWDMVNTSNRQEAQELARYLCRRISSELGVKTNGTKGGPFYVLKWTQMPAVLIEVGYLSNPAEEKMLNSGLYRQQIAEHIAAGILDYCQDFISVVKK
ncbi:MAG: N-acetylmuramoyl-L-alanine amidase [Candidatus Omnitrophica bacterium]|nr:N-acetylmuramoyl-L-alanine amidase [Candidatus Omnitrophota bacterium]